MTQSGSVNPAELKPGMEFCTFDFQKWGDFHSLLDEEGTTYLVGTVDGSGLTVYVPASEIVETHGQCIRLTATRALIDDAGWDQRPQA